MQPEGPQGASVHRASGRLAREDMKPTAEHRRLSLRSPRRAAGTLDLGGSTWAQPLPRGEFMSKGLCEDFLGHRLALPSSGNAFSLPVPPVRPGASPLLHHAARETSLE